MFELFKKSGHQAVKKRFLLWHKACAMLIEDQEALDSPRGKIGTLCFFVGGIDAICQAHKIGDKEWIEITEDLIQEIDLHLPSSLVLLIIEKYFLEEKTIPFIQKTIKEGGQCANDFLSGRNKMAPLTYAFLVKEWSEKPDLNVDEATYLI